MMVEFRAYGSYDDRFMETVDLSFRYEEEDYA
jgi:hypothetical protein